MWDGKTFAPAGNITLSSGGSGSSWDGTLEVRTNATLSAATTQSHSIGGSFLLGQGATLIPANSTFTFTATTTGKTITATSSPFYNITFNGIGGNWSFSGDATTTNDFTITRGTVTLSSGTTTIGGSFVDSDAFVHNNGTVSLISTASGKNIRASSSPFSSTRRHHYRVGISVA